MRFPPENDEMLRILRAMQSLALLIHQAPGRMAADCGRLDGNLPVVSRRLKRLSDAWRPCRKESRAALGRNESRHIEAAIHSAARASREAAADLSRSLLHLNWTSVAAAALGLYLFGLVTGFLLFR